MCAFCCFCFPVPAPLTAPSHPSHRPLSPTHLTAPPPLSAPFSPTTQGLFSKTFHPSPYHDTGFNTFTTTSKVHKSFDEF